MSLTLRFRFPYNDLETLWPLRLRGVGRERKEREWELRIFRRAFSLNDEAVSAVLAAA
jgi:hypothetical protein